MRDDMNPAPLSDLEDLVGKCARHPGADSHSIDYWTALGALQEALLLEQAQADPSVARMKSIEEMIARLEKLG